MGRPRAGRGPGEWGRAIGLTEEPRKNRPTPDQRVLRKPPGPEGAFGRPPQVPPRRRPIPVRGEIPGPRRRGRNSRAGGTVMEKAGLTPRRRPGRWPQLGGWLLVLSGSAALPADAL